ncbi:MAG: PH domain-containing protein [Clostridia bacterium]
MRIKSTVDKWFNILIFSIIVILLGSVVIMPQEAMLLSFLLIIPVIAFLLWIVFGTYYELREDYLYCKSGPFREKIYYDKIQTIKLSNNLFSSMALSSKRIEIRQVGKGYFAGTTMISPINREMFLVELQARCKKLAEEKFIK